MTVLIKVKGASFSDQARDVSERLSRNAESVCRHYLPKGRREGRYWLVGDVHGTPGRSLYVRLHASDAAKGAAGKWSDAATGEHGDLLDLIAANCHLSGLSQTLDEARRFLALPQPEPDPPNPRAGKRAPPSTSARKLFAMSRPVSGTLGETYLRTRGITAPLNLPALRFHPRCYYWPSEDMPLESWPALIAAITNTDGQLTGVHRTWLAADGSDKAPVETQRRAMGAVLGHAIRFGQADDVQIAGEGVETILSLLGIMPGMPMAACTSANHLAAYIPPPGLKRLYVARDRDAAGAMAFAALDAKTGIHGVKAVPLDPMTGDFNEDLKLHGRQALLRHVRAQLDPEDAARFCSLA
jgi:Toprim domain